MEMNEYKEGLDVIKTGCEHICGDKSENEKTTSTVGEPEKHKLIGYYEALGLSDYIKVDGELIYSYENLQVGSQIIEEYFGKEVSEEEKKAVLMCILGTPLLRNNNIRYTCNLSTLVNRIKATGLENREVCAIIIRLGIDGKIFNYPYGTVLYRARHLTNDVLNCKEKEGEIKADSEDTLEKAKIKSRYIEQEINICQYYRSLGIEDIYNEHGKLCYSESDLTMVRQIVEGYFEGEEVTDEIKKAVIRSLLKRRELRIDKIANFEKLLIIINKLRGKMIADKDIYGFLINLSCTNTLKGFACTYSGVLTKSNELDCITAEDVKHSSTVLPKTLEKMVNLMKKKEGRTGRVCGRDLAREGAKAPVKICDESASQVRALMEIICGENYEVK